MAPMGHTSVDWRCCRRVGRNVINTPTSSVGTSRRSTCWSVASSINSTTTVGPRHRTGRSWRTTGRARRRLDRVDVGRCCRARRVERTPRAQRSRSCGGRGLQRWRRAARSCRRRRQRDRDRRCIDVRKASHRCRGAPNREGGGRRSHRRRRGERECQRGVSTTGMDAVRDWARPVPGRPSGGVRSGVDVPEIWARSSGRRSTRRHRRCCGGDRTPRVSPTTGGGWRPSYWGLGNRCRPLGARSPTTFRRVRSWPARSSSSPSLPASATDAQRSGSASAPAARRGGWRSMVVSSLRRQILPQRSRSGCEQW